MNRLHAIVLPMLLTMISVYAGSAPAQEDPHAACAARRRSRPPGVELDHQRGRGESLRA